MRVTEAGLLVATVGVLTGCGVPGEAQVRKAFQRENPTCTVTDVYVSEGDASAVYFTIKYRDLASQTDRRACWQYINRGKEGWLLNRKDSVAEPAPPHYCR